MTRSEAIKAFFFKSVLPVTMALILYCIFKSACMKNGEIDYVWLWILCGLPFGLHRMCLWIVPGGGSLGGGIALFALNFIIGGVIGGIFTATESAAVACLYAFIVTFFIYREIPLSKMDEILLNALRTLATVLALLACCNAFGWFRCTYRALLRQ